MEVVNPLRIMIFRHTKSAWICHEGEFHKPCPSRIIRLEYKWKDKHENWTAFSFCLDCNALGITDPLDTTDPKLLKLYEKNGYLNQEIYAKHFGPGELPPVEHPTFNDLFPKTQSTHTQQQLPKNSDV
jgi:hypothetical protein